MSKKKTGITVDVKKVIAAINKKMREKNPNHKDITQGKYNMDKRMTSRMTFNNYSNGNAPDAFRLVKEMQDDSGLPLSEFITIEKSE